MIEAKICAKYGLKKELSEFQKRPNSNTYYGTCKKCKNVYSKQYRKEKNSNDPLFKLTVTIRHLISNSSRRQGYTKKTRTYKILGCDYDEFNKYLLETYKNNYGHDWDEIKDVHIDHIISLATATSEEEIIKLCHYSNLQLLKAKDNLDKKDKFD